MSNNLLYNVRVLKQQRVKTVTDKYKIKETGEEFTGNDDEGRNAHDQADYACQTRMVNGQDSTLVDANDNPVRDYKSPDWMKR